MSFSPDYNNIKLSAENIEAPRIPLYEHLICTEIMEKILNKPFAGLLKGDYSDKKEYFRCYCDFFRRTGYDTVSFEQTITSAMPGSGSLYGHKEGVIRSRQDFERYPWDEIPEIYFKRYADDYRALREVMPAGMMGIGGPGNGVFECVQDIVGYMDLCYISVDDPELYGDLFAKVGETNYQIWQRFMKEFSDIYCVMRFGDDLGYKSNTMLPAQDVKQHIIPQYKKITDLVHSYGKRFVFHSCGCIFDVMEDLIEVAGIDAKHSNEDQIARFKEWVDRYGNRIGNFGGIDADVVCRGTEQEIREYALDVIKTCKGHGGFAFGTGNSVPDYMPVSGYLAMVNTLREYRGDFK